MLTHLLTCSLAHATTQAYWVPLSSPSCDAESGVGLSDISESRGVHLLPSVGSYQLCYRFEARALPGHTPSPADTVKVEAGLYPAIVLIVIAIDASRAAPSGTAVGCESNITIPVTLPAAGLN